MLKLNLTDLTLDKLGFLEYWDEHGTWGTRTLKFKDGTKFKIVDQEEMDDDTEGYGDGMYVSQHFYFQGLLASPKIEGYHELYFLHDMYNCIRKYYPSYLNEFVEICVKLKMGKYIDEIFNDKYNNFLKNFSSNTWISKWEGVVLVESEENIEIMWKLLIEQDEYWENYRNLIKVFPENIEDVYGMLDYVGKTDIDDVIGLREKIRFVIYQHYENE